MQLDYFIYFILSRFISSSELIARGILHNCLHIENTE